MNRESVAEEYYSEEVFQELESPFEMPVPQLPPLSNTQTTDEINDYNDLLQEYDVNDEDLLPEFSATEEETIEQESPKEMNHRITTESYMDYRMVDHDMMDSPLVANETEKDVDMTFSEARHILLSGNDNKITIPERTANKRQTIDSPKTPTPVEDVKKQKHMSSMAAIHSGPLLQENGQNITNVMISSPDTTITPKTTNNLTVNTQQAAQKEALNVPKPKIKKKRSSYYVGHLEDQRLSIDPYEPYRSAHPDKRGSFQTRLHQKKENFRMRFFSFIDELETKPGSRRSKSLKSLVTCCCCGLVLFIIAVISVICLNYFIGDVTGVAADSAPAPVKSTNTFTWDLSSKISNNAGTRYTIVQGDSQLQISNIPTSSANKDAADYKKFKLDQKSWTKELKAGESTIFKFKIQVDVSDPNIAALCDNNQTFAQLKIPFEYYAPFYWPKSFSVVFQMPCFSK